MSPRDCAGAPQLCFMQSVSGEGLKVKNTFIDGWLSDESVVCAGRRRAAARTCPDFTSHRSEPESEPAPPVPGRTPGLGADMERPARLASGGGAGEPLHEPASEASPGAASPDAAPALQLPAAARVPGDNPFCLTPRAGAPKRVRFASSAEEFPCAAGPAQPSSASLAVAAGGGALEGPPWWWAPSPVGSEEAVEFPWPGCRPTSPAGGSEESPAASAAAAGAARGQPAPAAGARAQGRRRRRGGSGRASAERAAPGGPPLATAASGAQAPEAAQGLPPAPQQPPRELPRQGLQELRPAGQRCGAAAAGGRREGAPRGSRASKLWCHLFLDECMLARGFDLAKKIIGHGGSGTRGIFSATGAKIRLRGRGSGHLEDGREAPVPLMLAVTTGIHEVDSFSRAMQMATDHLRGVEEKFKGFCRRSQLPLPARCFWVGEISEGGAACLGNSVLESCRLATAQRPAGAAGR